MLTTKQIEHAKPKEKLYRLFDSHGLYLEVHPHGGKYWRLKYYYLGKEKRLAIGTYLVKVGTQLVYLAGQCRELPDNRHPSFVAV